jgi:hypothetical protein
VQVAAEETARALTVVLEINPSVLGTVAVLRCGELLVGRVSVP